MNPESIELIRRMELMINNKNHPHNPYYPNRETWVRETKAKIEEIKRKESNGNNSR